MKKFYNVVALVFAAVLLMTSVTACQGIKFTVSFETNGGSIVEPLMIAKDELIPVPEEPTKAGYTFGGWFTKNNFVDGTKYDFDEPVTKDITLFAKWTLIPVSYTVTFDTRGGSEVASQSVSGGQSATRPAEDPTKDGFSFVNWYADALGATPYAFGAVERDTTVYAKWSDIPGYVFFIDKSSSYVAQQAAMEKADGADAFADRTDLFTYVGDDNEYILPVTFKDYNENAATDCSAVEITVRMDGEVAGAEYYRTINNTKIQFTELAIGKDVSIEVKLNAQTIMLDKIKVIDGYNVYSAADLAKVTHVIKDYKGRDILRTATVRTNAIVLQNNLEIVSADFAGLDIFETAKDGDADKAAFDKLKDGKALKDNIYLFVLAASKANDSNFFEVGDRTLIGNYFTIDLTNLPPVVRDNGEIKKLETDNDGNITNSIDTSTYLFRICDKNDYVIKNLNVVGNSGVADAERAFTNSGGCGVFEAIGRGSNFTINNVNSNFAITLLSASMKGNETVVTLSNSKVYNCFAQSIYSSISKLDIQNSILKDCGGPLLSLSSRRLKDSTETEMPIVKIDSRSVLENWVTGGEAWFVINDAQMLAGALTSSAEGGIRDNLSKYGRTIIKQKDRLDCFNFIAITLNTYDFGESESGLYYSFSDVTIYDSETRQDVSMKHNPNSPEFKKVAQGIDQAKGAVMTTSANGIIGIDKTICEELHRDFAENSLNCTKGSYINIETDIGKLMGYGAGAAGTIGFITGYYSL